MNKRKIKTWLGKFKSGIWGGAMVATLSLAFLVSAYSGNANVVVEGDYIEASRLGSSGEEESLGIAQRATKFTHVELTGDLGVTGDVSVGGETVVDGFTQGGGCLSTTTVQNAYTMLQSDLLTYNCFEILQNTASFTWTLPATSTLTTLIPNAGDSREWFFVNATSTAGVTFTAAAGTGVNLIAVTANDDVIDGTERMWMKWIRRSSGDVDVLVSELLNAD